MADALLLRRALLLQLEAASPASLPVDTVVLGAACAGFDCPRREILAALDYLAQKNCVELSRSSISAAHVRARLSAVGRDYLESGEF